MANSFSTQGSTAGNPQSGLLGNPKALQFASAPQARPMDTSGGQGINNFLGNVGGGIIKGLTSVGNAIINPTGGTQVQPTSTGTTDSYGLPNPFGNLQSGILGNLNKGLGFPATHPEAPTTSPTSHTVTTAPDGTTTTKQTFDNSGNKKSSGTNNSSGSSTSGTYGGTAALPTQYSYDSATGKSTPTGVVYGQTNNGNSGGASTDATVTPPVTTPTTPTTPQVGTPTQNAQNVLDASSLANNPEYQAGTQGVNLYTAGQQNAALAPYAGMGNNLSQGATDQLGVGYSNLFRPQGTANLQGELGAESGLLNQGLTAATQEQQAAINAGQLATTGATSVLNAGLPRQYGAVNLNPFNPDTTGGGTAANAIAMGATADAAKALSDQNAQILQPQLDTFTANSTLLTNTLKSAGTNDLSLPYLNGLQQMAAKNLISQNDLAAFTAMVDRLKSQGASIDTTQSLGSIFSQLQGQQDQIKNQIQANENQIAKYGSSSTSGGSTGGTGTTIQTPYGNINPTL